MTFVTPPSRKFTGRITPKPIVRKKILQAIRELAQSNRRAHTRGGLVTVLSHGDLYEHLLYSRKQIDDTVAHHGQDLKRSKIRIA